MVLGQANFEDALLAFCETWHLSYHEIITVYGIFETPQKNKKKEKKRFCYLCLIGKSCSSEILIVGVE